MLIKLTAWMSCSLFVITFSRWLQKTFHIANVFFLVNKVLITRHPVDLFCSDLVSLFSVFVKGWMVSPQHRFHIGNSITIKKYDNNVDKNENMNTEQLLPSHFRLSSSASVLEQTTSQGITKDILFLIEIFSVIKVEIKKNLKNFLDFYFDIEWDDRLSWIYR